MPKKSFKTSLRVGLGEAITRVNYLDNRLIRSIGTEEQRVELALLMDALNKIQIDLGFDCDGDGVPDSIEIFTATATTSCCRLVDLDEDPKPQRKRATRSRSRKKK